MAPPESPTSTTTSWGAGNGSVQKTRTANRGSGDKGENPKKKILRKAMANYLNYLSVGVKKTTMNIGKNKHC